MSNELWCQCIILSHSAIDGTILFRQNDQYERQDIETGITEEVAI